MRRLLAATLLAAGLGAGIAQAGTPDGENIVLHGTDHGTLPCAACHGDQGQGNPAMGAPALAGLPAATIEAALASFAGGGGNNPTMQMVAKSLTPDETKAVAAYLASLPKP